MTKKLPKISKNYECVICDYNTSKASSYSKHLLTAKHIRLTEDDGKSAIHYKCECGKEYNQRQGLWRHKQLCVEKYSPHIENKLENIDLPLPTHLPNPEEMMAIMFEFMRDKLPDKSDQSHVVLELLKQNQDFKELIIEQNKQMLELANKAGHNTNCNNNTTNNKFNLNVFLNETCKDAISMDDFIKSFEVTRDEFLHTGKVGYIEGLSAVMANRFKDMDVHTRPLHCTDLKRETIYIKNADKWEKDDADKTHMRKAVRGVARKNKQEMWRWYDENKPEVEQIGTDVCEDYFQYHKAALGGYGKEEDLKFEDKIIHNVLTGVHIDKSSALTI